MQNLTRHLKEAIDINTLRMPLYGKLSDGATIPFSKELIRYEKLALLGAWFFDRKGDTLQQKGVPFLEAELVEMSLTPKFSESYPSEIDFTPALKKMNVQAFYTLIREQINTRKYSSVVDTCQDFVDELKNQAHLYCMLRHLVESLGRIAYLIPFHQEQCETLNIDPPTRYSHRLLVLHAWSIKKATQLDEAVAGIQNKGIPFLYQDLPPIEIRVKK